MARKYQEIWERIKKHSKCTIRCHPAAVKRVKKAVIKEKHQDTGWKVLHDDDYYFLEATYTNDNQQLVFQLKRRIGEL